MPGSAGQKAPVSKPSWRCCSQLCHLGGGPYWDCFSLLCSYQACSNQLTCYKDPDIRQTSRPKTAGTKLPKGPIRRDEGDFLTLQEGPRVQSSITKSPCRSILTLSRTLKRSCVLATRDLHIVFQYSSQQSFSSTLAVTISRIWACQRCLGLLPHVQLYWTVKVLDCHSALS